MSVLVVEWDVGGREVGGREGGISAEASKLSACAGRSRSTSRDRRPRAVRQCSR